MKHNAGALCERRDGSSREKTEGDLGRIWVQPFPSFTLICYNCAGFFICFVLFAEWGMGGGGGGNAMKRRKKKLHSLLEKKNSNLTSFLQFVAFSVSFSAVLFKGKIFIKFHIQIYRKMCGQLFFFIEHWQKDIRWI